MLCQVIELLYQRDKEKVFNLLQLHRASSYSLGMESEDKQEDDISVSKNQTETAGPFHPVTACES